MLITKIPGGTGGGEDISAELAQQQALIEQLLALVGTSIKPEKAGGHFWFKYPAGGGSLVEILWSEDESAYPNGVGEDGFEYIKVDHAVGVDSNGETFIFEI